MGSSDTKDVYRGYMDSEELIKWIFKILMSSNKSCNIYNVGSDEAITIENLAKLIGKKFNKIISKQKKKKYQRCRLLCTFNFKSKKRIKFKNKF